VLEDIIFHEITQAHPSRKVLGRRLGDTHHIWDFVVSPHHFGYPARRCRRMSICLSKLLALELEPIWQGPRCAFGAPEVTAPGFYFNDTPQEAVETYLQYLRIRRKCLQAVCFKDLLTSSERRILHGYEKFISKLEVPLACHIFDLRQTCACPLFP
jgi:hypothetical protein